MIKRLHSFLEYFWAWVDSRAIVRRVVLAYTLYMTWYGVHACIEFAKVSQFDGLGTAAVIAAVLAPIAALQGFAFANYTNGRRE